MDLLNRFKTTFIAALILVVLGAYILITERRTGGSGENKRLVLPSLAVRQIDSISLKFPEGAAELKKTDGGWVVLKGDKEKRRYPADSYSVKSMLDTLSGIEIENIAAVKAEDLEPFGLSAPRAEINFGGGGKEHTLRIGDDTPTGSGTYVMRVGSGDVFIVDSNSLYPLLFRTPDDLRDKNILSIDEAAVTAIKFTRKGSSFEIVNTEGVWSLKEPRPYVELDQPAVRGLLGTFARLNISRFVEDEPKRLHDYGLRSPGATVEIAHKGKKTAIVFGGEKEGQRYVKISGRKPVYSVLEYIYELIPKGVNDIRSKRLIKEDLDSLTEVSVEGPGTVAFKYEKKGLVWKKGGNTKTVEGVPDIESVFSSLHALRIKQFVDDEPVDLSAYGLEEPVAKLTMVFPNAVLTVLFGNAKDGMVYVMLPGASPVYAVLVKDAGDFIGTEIGGGK